jgi:hypothetical protein
MDALKQLMLISIVIGLMITLRGQQMSRNYVPIKKKLQKLVKFLIAYSLIRKLPAKLMLIVRGYTKLLHQPTSTYVLIEMRSKMTQ